jgi:hypothetical protein
MFTTSRLDGTTAFAEADDAFALIKASGPLELVTTGPTAGNELRVAGHKATWIVRLGDRATAGSLDAFASRFGSISVSEQADGALVVNDPDYGQVVFAADGSATAEGRKVDPATWSIEGQAVLLN